MSSYRLFIDDDRFPADGDEDMVVVRSSAEAIAYVRAHGMPSHIAFDHDLAAGDIAMTFVRWMENALLDGEIALPDDFTYYVHSQNPEGAKNIRGALDPLIRHLKERGSAPAP